MGDLAAAGAEMLGSLGSSAAEAAPAIGAGLETGVGTLGAGLGEVAGGGVASLGDIVGSGAGLFGGTLGTEGTALAGGAGGLADLIGTGGATALGTAEAFMGSPAASGFGSGAAGAPSAFGGVSSSVPGFPGGSSALSPNVANANAGASVFDTGAAPIQGVSGTGAPSAGASASSVAAPTGVSSLVDPTAAAAGQTAGATPAAGQAAAATPSITDVLKNAGSSAVKSLTSNPIGTALGAAGLGYNIMSGQKQTANQNALAADAKTATANSDKMVASGEALQQYLTNGTLPAAYQQQVDNAINDAKTTAISNAASMGQPTDPTKNTALAATLAKIDASRAGMQAQVAGQLFSSGSSLVNAGQSAANLSGNLYQTLVQNDTQQAANTGKAIATLAAALNGKSNNSFGNVNVSTG